MHEVVLSVVCKSLIHAGLRLTGSFRLHDLKSSRYITPEPDYCSSVELVSAWEKQGYIKAAQELRLTSSESSTESFTRPLHVSSNLMTFCCPGLICQSSFFLHHVIFWVELCP